MLSTKMGIIGKQPRQSWGEVSRLYVSYLHTRYFGQGVKILCDDTNFGSDQMCVSDDFNLAPSPQFEHIHYNHWRENAPNSTEEATNLAAEGVINGPAC